MTTEKTLSVLRQALARSSQLAANSITGMHHKHADSVLLQSFPMIRMFYKRQGVVIGPDEIAIHSHHCDITIVPIMGTLLNVAASRGPIYAETYNCWRYSSKIRDGRGGFERLQQVESLATTTEVVKAPLYMPSFRLHTVACMVPETAWIVCEGEQDDPSYSPVTYSNNDLSKWSSEGLYGAMTEEQYRYIVNRAIMAVEAKL